MRKWNSCIEDFEALWLRFLSELGKKEVEKVVTSVVFENNFSSPTSVVQRALVGLSDFYEVNRKE